jgi:hypothetical protein
MGGPFDDDEIGSHETNALDELGRRFLKALADKDAGRVDRAEDELRAILAVEPRLGEPRIELARLLLDSDRVGEAEEHARDGLANLEKGGAWVEEVPPNVVLGIGHALLAEVLRRRADEDDVIFGDPDVWRKLVAESKLHFEKAAALDPADEYASYHAFFLGVKGHGAKVDFGDGVEESSDDE